MSIELRKGVTLRILPITNGEAAFDISDSSNTAAIVCSNISEAKAQEIVDALVDAYPALGQSKPAPREFRFRLIAEEILE